MNATPAIPPTTPPIREGVEGDVDWLEPPDPPVDAVLVGALPPEVSVPLSMPPTPRVSVGCVETDMSVEEGKKEEVVEVSGIAEAVVNETVGDDRVEDKV
jgi:hypothetical protein